MSWTGDIKDNKGKVTHEIRLDHLFLPGELEFEFSARAYQG